MKQTSTIERPVGEGEINRSNDLEAVRNALAERGYCRRSIAGQWNAKYKQDLTAGIRMFQRKAGLTPDGIVIPGGPTAHALALGGEVTGMHETTENKNDYDETLQAIELDIMDAKSLLPDGKQASRDTCATWREQIARAIRGIAAADRRIETHNSLIKELENDLRVAKAKLRADRRNGAADSRIATHNRLIKDLENDLRVANAKLKELETLRLNIVKAMAVIQARVDRQCV